MLYEFIHEPTGEIRTIIRSMKAPPPLKFRHGGKLWVRTSLGGATPIVRQHGVATGPYMEHAEIPQIAMGLEPNRTDWIYIIKNGVKVREHADGKFSDRFGRPIVESAKQMEQECAQRGAVWERE